MRAKYGRLYCACLLRPHSRRALGFLARFSVLRIILALSILAFCDHQKDNTKASHL
jgi:hypothetical protein